MPRANRAASEFDPLALLDIVAAVAAAAPGADLQTVSQRTWDTARGPAGHPDAPAARRIVEFIGLPWRKVCELAAAAPAQRSRSFGIALRQRDADWLTEDHVAFVLKVVARRLGLVTLTPDQYRREQQHMLAEDRARWMHGGQLRLPNEHQLAVAAGSWDRALALAELKPRQGVGGQRTRSRPAGIVHVLERCFAAHGTEPTIAELAAFAKANGIPFPRKERGRPYSDYVREWKDGRRAKGLPVPEGPPPKRERPDYDQDVGAAAPGERRARKRWDDVDELVDWVARYLAQLGRGKRPSQRDYDDWASQQDGAPWSSTLTANGGLDALLTAARRRRARTR
jgi:hypothetical protein